METIPTVTIEDNKVNCSFSFVRGSEGEFKERGMWVVKTVYRGLPPGTVVDLILAAELTLIAKDQGLRERGNFMAVIPVPVKPKRMWRRKEEEEMNAGPSEEKVPRAKRTRQNDANKIILTGFNPFKKNKSIPY